MVRLLGSATSAFLLASAALVQAQSNIPTCGQGKNCPENLPCCSQYGQCGLGAYCLGGCDPLFSHSLQSCVAAPVCRSQDYKLTSLDGITPNTEYLGDASKSNWVSSGQPKAFTDKSGDQVLLTMAKGSVGTLLASTSYVWYGKVAATLKTSRTAGVVTAFILLSDVKDEIDFEFVGTDLNSAQSNFYFEGVTNYANELNVSAPDTFGTYHTYEIDWTPETIKWSVDGKELRSLERSKTWNATANQYYYPQTPARIQLSLWPAGLSTNGKGTVEWSGGLVDWTAPDVTNAGYFYAMVKEVKVQCYDPPSGVKKSGSNAYIYSSNAGTNDSVQITNDNTVLKSQLGSGTNMSADFPKPVVVTGTLSSAAPAATSEIPTVPGLSGAGTGSNGQRGNPGVSSVSAAAPSSVAGSIPSDTASALTPADTGFHGFSQNGGPGTGTSQAAPQKGEKVLQGSLLAVLVAIVGMLTL